MAVLKNLETGASVALRARHRFGRSRINHSALSRPEVSGDHALIGFSGAWEVRDLGSRNGTWVNGQPIQPGTRHALKVADRIGLGTKDPLFEVLSVAPPSAIARCGDRWVEGDEDLLALPSQDDPQWILRYDGREGWVTDDGPLGDDTQIVVGADTWTVSVPEILPPTREQVDTGLSLMAATVCFAVSSDEEYVELSLRCGGEIFALPPKVHHYLLLTLARARLQDVESGTTEGEAGWRHTTVVQKMLRASKNQIYVSVHRLKKEVTGLGFLDGADVVERRKTTQQVRMGTSSIEIRSL